MPDDDRVPDDASPAGSDRPAEPSSTPRAGSGFPDRSKIDLSRKPTPGVPGHAAPDDAGDRPFIDLSRDPTPGVPDHLAPDDVD